MPTDFPERQYLEEYGKEQYARAHAWQERAERAERHVESLRQALQTIYDDSGSVVPEYIAELAQKALKATE
jgi:hypothetical protein